MALLLRAPEPMLPLEFGAAMNLTQAQTWRTVDRLLRNNWAAEREGYLYGLPQRLRGAQRRRRVDAEGAPGRPSAAERSEGRLARSVGAPVKPLERALTPPLVFHDVLTAAAARSDAS